MDRRRVRLAAACAGVLTLLLYLPALRNGFVNWDDYAYVLQNTHIRSLDGGFLGWAFGGFYQSNWHPLTWISHALDYAVWGLNPAGHHLTSILLHALNASLVVLLAAELWEGASRSGAAEGQGRGLILGAFTAGALFGVHPVHVESAAWVSERKDLLCGVFYIAGTIMYLRYARGSTGDARFLLQRYYLASLGFSALAFMSKPMAVSFPVVLLLLDWYPLGRIRSAGLRRIVLEKIPFGVMALASSVVTVAAQQSTGAVASMGSVPPVVRLLVAVQSLGRYLEVLLLPAGLSPFYPYPVDITVISGEYLIPLALVALVTILCVARVRVNKLWLAAWAYLVLTLAPVLGIMQIGGQAMADRYLYLPSIGPFIAAGGVAAYAGSRVSRTVGRLGLAAGGISVLVALAVLTLHQVAIWKNSTDLWRAAIDAVPDPGAYRTTYVIYHNLGMAQEEQGRPAEALASYSAAIRLHPSFAATYANRAALYARLGHHDEAISDYETALSLGPQRPDLYYNLGNSHARMGMNDAAIADYTMAIGSSKVPRADYYENRGVVYRRLKRDDLAAEDLSRAAMLRAGAGGRADEPRGRQ